MAAIPPDALTAIQDIQKVTQLLQAELERLQTLSQSFESIGPKVTDFQDQAVSQLEKLTNGLTSELIGKAEEVKGEIQKAINEALKLG
jgi:hypothetical protein